MTKYKLVPVEPTEEMLRAPFHGRFSNGADQIRMKHIYKAMLAAAPEPAPLPDDVAAFVERLRTGGESYEELLDLCTRQAVDMLESMSWELSVVQEENVKLQVQQIEYVDTSAEQQAKNEELREHMRELAAVKAENGKLREDAERYRWLAEPGRTRFICKTFPVSAKEELDSAIDAAKEGKA